MLTGELKELLVQLKINLLANLDGLLLLLDPLKLDIGNNPNQLFLSLNNN